MQCVQCAFAARLHGIPALLVGRGHCRGPRSLAGSGHGRTHPREPRYHACPGSSRCRTAPDRSHRMSLCPVSYRYLVVCPGPHRHRGTLVRPHSAPSYCTSGTGTRPWHRCMLVPPGPGYLSSTGCHLRGFVL